MAPTTPATTSASNVPTVLNFTIPKNGSDTCLILQFAIDMTIKYTAKDVIIVFVVAKNCR